MRAEPAIRVVLAEDAVLLREGLAGLLERFGFQVAAVTGDAERAQRPPSPSTPRTW